jgi:hypothetical protein
MCMSVDIVWKLVEERCGCDSLTEITREFSNVFSVDSDLRFAAKKIFRLA